MCVCVCVCVCVCICRVLATLNKKCEAAKAKLYFDRNFLSEPVSPICPWRKIN